MEKINTTFSINGGAGRVICAIPALEKYARLNPDDDFKVIVHGWESLYWSHPLLQNKTVGISQKGIFDLYIKPYNLIVPEPYDRRSYYTQQKSIIEAFDEEINNTNDHSDLGLPKLYTRRQEDSAIKFLLNKEKERTNKNKIIVFQPYGSGIGIVNDRPYDGSIRSLDIDDYIKIGRVLSRHAIVIFFGPRELVHPQDDFSYKPFEIQPDLRFWISAIKECDYYLGCDSLGQHIARAFNKPGTVIMGSTFERNVTYPDHFKIFRNGLTPTYNPIRIGGIDCDFADRANDDLMYFTDEQLQVLTKNVLTDMKIKFSESKGWPY